MKTIELTQGKVALVDDSLYEALNQFKWCALKRGQTFYGARNVRLPSGKWTTYLMHRFIFELRGEALPKMVDHWDHNGLNCQRENLRAANHSENGCNSQKRATNTSGYIGVSWHKQRKKWCARANVNGKGKNLGYFHNPRTAAVIRDVFVKHHHGEFAVLNF